MPKVKWDGAEEPTTNNFYKIDRNTPWRQVSSGIPMAYIIYSDLFGSLFMCK